MIQKKNTFSARTVFINVVMNSFFENIALHNFYTWCIHSCFAKMLKFFNTIFHSRLNSNGVNHILAMC